METCDRGTDFGTAVEAVIANDLSGVIPQSDGFCETELQPMHEWLSGPCSLNSFPVPLMAAFAHSSSRMLLKDEFLAIEQLTAKNFTHDACCDDSGCNALVPQSFSSPAKSFLQYDVVHQHVFVHPTMQFTFDCHFY